MTSATERWMPWAMLGVALVAATAGVGRASPDDWTVRVVPATKDAPPQLVTMVRGEMPVPRADEVHRWVLEQPDTDAKASIHRRCSATATATSRWRWSS